MRVTGGKYLRRTVLCPKGVIRPAMDRMRESLFSILGDLDNLSFLDLFSGSGIMAIEAASRNAKKVVLVEKDFIKKDVLKKNLSFLTEEYKIHFTSAEKFITNSKEKFDIIYIDPPFPMKDKEKLLFMISKSFILKEDSIVIIHYPAEDDLKDEIGMLKSFDKRKYGRSKLIFYKAGDKTE